VKIPFSKRQAILLALLPLVVGCSCKVFRHDVEASGELLGVEVHLIGISDDVHIESGPDGWDKIQMKEYFDPANKLGQVLRGSAKPTTKVVHFTKPEAVSSLLNKSDLIWDEWIANKATYLYILAWPSKPDATALRLPLGPCCWGKSGKPISVKISNWGIHLTTSRQAINKKCLARLRD